MTSGWPLPFGICYAMLGRARSGGMHCAARLDCSAVQLRARSRWPAVEDSVTGDRTNVASLKEERPVQSSPIQLATRARSRVQSNRGACACACACGEACMGCRPGSFVRLDLAALLQIVIPPDKYVHYLARYCLGACFILSPEHEIHMLPN